MRNATYRRILEEKELASAAIEVGDFDKAYAHAGIVHIIGQRHLVTHFEAHFLIMKIARLKGDQGAFMKQFLHLLHALPASLLKIYPKGNTGLSDVSLFQKIDVAEDLLEHL